MKPQTEIRISRIETKACCTDSDVQTEEALVLAVCEVARQLAHLVDLYQFELGLDEIENVRPRAAEPQAGPQFSDEFLDGK